MDVRRSLRISLTILSLWRIYLGETHNDLRGSLKFANFITAGAIAASALRSTRHLPVPVPVPERDSYTLLSATGGLDVAGLVRNNTTADGCDHY